MSAKDPRWFSYREAARLIYGVREPTPEQIAKVAAKVSSGQLRGNRMTDRVAADSVVRYIAGKTEDHRLRDLSRRTTESAAGANPPVESLQVLRPIYREGLREYLAAVVRRRYAPGASAGFRRAVLAGQLALVALSVVVICCAWLMREGVPPERRVIEAQLDREVAEGKIGGYEIIAWGLVEPRPDGAPLRVKFRYRSAGGKSVITDRVYRVQGDQASRIDDSP